MANRSGLSSDTVETGNRQQAHGGYHFDYDGTGNLVRKYKTGDTLTFNQRFYWNSFNELDSVRYYAGGWQALRFGYDAAGRRVRVRSSAAGTTTYYVWSGSQVVAEYDSASGNLLRHYTYYRGTDRPHSVLSGGTRYYFASDGQANVTGLMESAATTVRRHSFTAFGEAVLDTGSVANRIRFSGRELDVETGLYYNRARYYDPQVGRFISEDPSGLAGGINSYAFGAGDPINRRDPTGNGCVWRGLPDSLSRLVVLRSPWRSKRGVRSVASPQPVTTQRSARLCEQEAPPPTLARIVIAERERRSIRVAV